MNSLPLPDNAEQIMLCAVDLAMAGKGRTAPNPCVGAVLTMNDQVVAQGWHLGPGRAHAEAAAIADARDKNVDLSQCTLWVTLEPCNHQGRTPPCTRAILEAGIRRVVVGAADPNPWVTGGGAAFLRSQGLDVHLGVAETRCQDLIADFTTWVMTPRPYVYLKSATTLDGRIAARSGDSQWVSAVAARSMVHALRRRVGAVLVGAGTLRADNPRLTCRMINPDADTDQKQPLAVVAATNLPEADAEYALLRQRPHQTIFWTTDGAAITPRAQALRELGCRVWAAGRDRVDLDAALTRLRGELGVYDVLCEGGGRLAGQIVEGGLVGEWWLFLAPRTLGDERAVPVLAGASVERMDQARPWRLAQVQQADPDLLLILRPLSTDASCSPD